MKAAQIMKAIRKPVPWTQTEARLMATALMEDSCCELMAADTRALPKGAVRSRGYAGNTHVGVMVWIGKTLFLFSAATTQDRYAIGVWTYSVDHRIRYIPALANMPTLIYIQNETSRTRRSHGPVCGTPYSEMVKSIVAILCRASLDNNTTTQQHPPSAAEADGITYETNYHSRQYHKPGRYEGRRQRTYKCGCEERLDLVGKRGNKTSGPPVEAKRYQDAVHYEQAYVEEEENEAENGQPSCPKRNWPGESAFGVGQHAGGPRATGHGRRTAVENVRNTSCCL